MQLYENRQINTNHFMLQIVAFKKKQLDINQPLQIFAEAVSKAIFLIEVSLPDVAGKLVYQGHHPHRQGLLLLQVDWAAQPQQQAGP